MSNERNCKDCVFYKAPHDGYTCGYCMYPVPEWLRMSASGGGFISGHEAITCAMYKTPADVVQKEIENNT